MSDQTANNIEQPTVTVVMPLYNAERYVADAVASVMAQADVATELIVADDGSNDRSAEIVEKMSRDSQGRIRLLRLKHGGVSNARNAALDAARGKYVMYLDADDMLLPESVKKLVDTAESLPSKDHPIIVAGMTLPGRDYNEAKRQVSAKRDAIETVQPERAIELSLYRRTPGLDSSMSSKLFSKELFNDLRFRENTRFEDLDLYYRVFGKASGGITLTDIPVTFYRMHGESFTHSWSEGQLDSLAVTRRMMQRLGDKKRLARAVADRRVSAAFRLMVVMARCGEKNRRAMRACRLIIKRHGTATFMNRQARLRNRVAALIVSLIPMKR